MALDIALEIDSSLIWSTKTSYRKCHNNLFLVPSCKPPDTVKDLYDGQPYDLKTRVDIWTCSSSGVWNIHSEIPLDYVVLSVYYWDYLQVVLCAVAYY